MEEETNVNRVFKSAASVLLTASLAVTMTACGGSKTTPSGSTSGQETGSNTETKAEYAVVLKVLSSPFWQSMRDGILEEAEKQGIKVDIYAANSEDDVEGQVTLLENAINKGYKAIGVAPISADNLVPAVAEASKKGIYVINIDAKLNLDRLKELGGAVQAFVSTDNKAVGRMGAEYIIEQIGGSGQVAIIEGKAGAASGEDRKAGATAAFLEAGVELVESQPADWDRTKAYDLATNYIAKYPDLKGIYACNDTMAMGALEAVKAAGKDIVVVGTDGNDDAVASVKAGELSATVAQDPAQIGRRGVQLMLEVVKAGKPIDVNAEPQMESVDAILITKDAN
jgi:D-allose transport system substrate-binding protein